MFHRIFLVTSKSNSSLLRTISGKARVCGYKFLALLMLVCITSAPILAVPETPRFVAVSASETGQDIRLAYLTSGFSTGLGAVVSGVTNKLLQLSKGKRSDQVVRIEILPGGDVSIRQGEPINFSAIAYSSENVPVAGLRFDWEVEDVGRGRPRRPLQNGMFLAKKAGTFVITAKTQGFEGRVNVTVEENRPMMALRGIESAIANGQTEQADRLKARGQFTSKAISSRSNNGSRAETAPSDRQEDSEVETVPSEKLRGPNAGNGESEYSERTSAALRLPEEDGWGDDNWWLADDPGNQTGNPPGTSPQIGAGNGNFQISAPVVALPGRGIDVALSLNYNSRVWSKSGSKMIFDADRGFPAPGWNFGFGKMSFMGTAGGCMMIDADGTQHGYTGTISNYSYTNYSSTTFNGHTADGSFIDYFCAVSTYNGVTSMSGSARLPNGTTAYYYAPSANGKQAFPTRISDAQGNYIDISYRNGRGPSIQTITDTLGRVVTFNYDSLDRLISVDVPKMDNAGTRTAVRIHYKQLTLNPGWAYGTTTDTNNSYPYVIDAIYYPGTGTGYWFGADPNAADYNTYYSSYGMISKVVEQRGLSWSGTPGDQGTVTAGTMSKEAVYNYPLTPNYTLTDAPTFTTLTESWSGMDTSAAVTSYSVNMNSSPRTITVTQPSGLKSKQYMYNASGQWNDGLIYQDETLDAANNQLSKSVVTWEQGHYSSPRPSQTLTTDEKLQVLKTTFAYGSNYNQVTSQKQYDYDGVTLLRETRNTYENNSAYTNRHIFNLVTSSEIFNGAGNRVAKTDYEYDNNAVVNGTGNPNLKAAPGVTMHYSTHDPDTTDLMDGPTCLSGQWNNTQCTYEGETVWTTPWPTEVICAFECFEFEQISVYDPDTIFRGNLTKTTVYADATTPTPSGPIAHTKQYDIAGNLIAASASCCDLTTYDYTASTQYAYPTALSRGSADPNSTVKNSGTSVYDFYTGVIKQTVDSNGKTVTTTYNPDTLRPTQTTLSTGAYSQTTYDESAMKITEEVKESNGTLAGKTITYLNGVGQMKKQESIGPNGVTDIAEIIYNELGNEKKRSRPYRAGDPVYWTETFYDIQGRVLRIAEPDGSETKAFYNESAYPDSALVNGSPTPGGTLRVKDAWGRDRWGRYDALGNLVEVVEPNPDRSANPSGRLFDDLGAQINGSLITKYSYDTRGRLTQTLQGGQVRSVKYDSLGRPIRQKIAEQTATINDAGEYVGDGGTGALWSSSASYDNRSNLTERIDARGVKTKYSYQVGGNADPLNRLQSITYDLSGPRDTSKPIAAAPTVTYEYMTTGDQDRLKKVTVAGVSTDEFAFDSQARITDHTKTILSRSSYPLVTSYTYDTLSRITSTRYPSQYGLAGAPRKLVQHEFDTAGRVTALKIDGTQHAGSIVYDAADRITSINLGTPAASQINEQYTFDPQTGFLTNQKAIKDSTTTLLDLSYDYGRNNSVGNVSGKTGHLTKIVDNLNNAKNREYEFDAIGRLIKAKGGTNSLWTQTYSYDRFGNRTSVATTGVAADAGSTPMVPDGIPSLSYNASTNRITTSNAGGQFEYDLAGNQTRALAEDGQSWRRFEYDAANRLVEIKQDDATPLQSEQFGFGNDRLWSNDYVLDQKTYYADNAAEYTEVAGNGVLVWKKILIHFGGSVMASITRTGKGREYMEYHHPDRLGTRLSTDPLGATSYEQIQLPFGTALDAESTGATGRRFTSYERSARTGLDFAQNRTYDPKQGRFTQVDPIGMRSVELSNPQTLNLYAYCTNDPINYVDPSGLGFFSFLKKLFKWIMVAVAVVVAVITIVGIVAAPFTIAGLLGAISAGAGAAASVLGALGYQKAARIFGIIAVVTGIGALIAANAAAGSTFTAFLDGKLSFQAAWAEFAALEVARNAALHGLFTGVGGVVNSLAQTKDGKKIDKQEIIRQTYLRVLERLAANAKCLETIQHGHSVSPKDSLKAIFERGDIKPNNDIKVAEQTTPGQTDTGWIDLGPSFFKKTIVDGKGNDWNKITTLNEHRTREFIFLHALRHLHGADHIGEDGFKKDITEVLRDCFGVTPDFSGGIK